MYQKGLRGFNYCDIIVVGNTRHNDTIKYPGMALAMINSTTEEYYRNYYGAYLCKYLEKENAQDTRVNYIIAFIVICIMLASLAVIQPIFAKTDTGPGGDTIAQNTQSVYRQDVFEQNIRLKYKNSIISFPAKGIAHIKKVKYINSKPIRINVVELNTNVNPHLKIKPQTASVKLNSKTTVRKIANNSGAIVAINGGFFKPQTGVPLGALMIDRKVLTGPIYNRVGIAIFENKHKTTFKMDKIDFGITAKTAHHSVKVDNINQPRMLQSYMLLYTDDWGKMSPIAPKTGYNMLIKNKKVVKISANPVEIGKGEMVLQGNKNLISMLALDGDIDIDIKLQEGFQDAKHIISAGPYLVKDSQVFVDTQAQKLQAISGKNPRSAVGFRSDGTFIIVTVDGREKTSVGMTLWELAKFMKEIGCEYAMNFDGGSSSAIYVKGKIANSAINREGISVSNALVVSESESRELQLAGI